MSLSCLTCQNLPRVDSDKEFNESCVGIVDKPHFTLPPRKTKVDRSWSGNLAPRPYEKTRNESKIKKKGHNRIHSALDFEEDGPRLVRSCGMRRDWSFEDLRQRREETIKGVQGH